MPQDWNTLRLEATDALLGWLLWLPRDLALVLLAVLTAIVLIVIRRSLTRQVLLRETQSDLRRLRELIADARRNGQRSAMERLRRVRVRVAWIRVREQLPPLLVSLPLLTLVLVWGGERLHNWPPRSGDLLVFTVHTPATWIGEVVHLVPNEGWEANTGWVQAVHETVGESGRQGTAAWTLRAGPDPEATAFIVRLPDRTVEHAILVGRGTYAPMRVRHSEQLETAVQLRVYRPFGIVGEWSWFGMAPWLAGYLLLTVPLFLVVKRLAGVA